ncbi:receptor-like protein 34 [Cryptomeria japonica]|uniref:receptor-like protein 34 n=1 Tax=Cryptomeria japonica TaxID=3369 RepID=UPI0027D9D6DE|nr:receptor-like protein 34 [Cryptomeria japonica]
MGVTPLELVLHAMKIKVVSCLESSYNIPLHFFLHVFGFGLGLFLVLDRNENGFGHLAGVAAVAYYQLLCMFGGRENVSLGFQESSFNLLSIPPQVGELRRLKNLRLSDCGFIGQIPREIGNMSTLKFLDLSYNEGLQSSNLGDWITNLRGLEYLDLSYNNLTMAGDTLLGSIASLTNLTTIRMYGCGLSGEIPPSFANLSRLQWLGLSGNSLRGKIPAFGAPLPLSYLALSANNLEGSLPSSLGGLSKLQSLYLYSNKLNGSIPSILGNLSALRILYLQNNSLSGPIPTSFAKLSKLEVTGPAGDVAGRSADIAGDWTY